MRGTQIFATMLVLICLVCASNKVSASTEGDSVLSDLTNYQINTVDMVSAGLPNKAQFLALKASGVNKVVDLIPGDRSEEIALMKALNLDYHNIAVEWGEPTLKNFEDYVIAMQSSKGEVKQQGITLTHCKLNWRGAVFTYLYRVTQLNEAEAIARKDLDATWKPNKTWRRFISEVKARYKTSAAG